MPNKHLSKPQRFYASDTGKVVDEDYLDYIRKLPCVGCGRTPVDPDHLIARGFEEGKRVDYYAIPMCRQCHSEREQVGNVKFQIRHQMDGAEAPGFIRGEEAPSPLLLI